MKRNLMAFFVIIVILILGCEVKKTELKNTENPLNINNSVSINNFVVEKEGVSLNIDLSSPERIAEEYMKLYTTSLPGENMSTINILFVNSNIETYLNQPIKFRKIDNYKLSPVDWDEKTIVVGVRYTFENKGIERYGIIISFVKINSGYKIAKLLIGPSVFSDVKD